MAENAKLSLKKDIKAAQKTEFLHHRALKKASESLDESFPPPGRRRIEKELFNFISLGNFPLAKQFIDSLTENGQTDFRVGNLSENSLQQARFAVIASITLFCRTAVDSGLPENLAYSISDVYIQYLGNTRDEESIYHLFIQSFLEYCQAMQNWRLSDCSPQLKICCEYIMGHLYSKITMDDLGRICSLSPNYVSDLFKKELGIRPSIYIRREKVRYAAYLIRNTSMTGSDIAELLAFPSASAFSYQFREMYGCTPRQYRHLPESSDEFS